MWATLWGWIGRLRASPPEEEVQVPPPQSEAARRAEMLAFTLARAGAPGADEVGHYRVIDVAGSGWVTVDGDDHDAPVLVHPGHTSPSRVRFVHHAEFEALAQSMRGVPAPALVRVRRTRPWIVFDAPPPQLRPAEPLAAEDAASCVLDVCEVLAFGHAAGWSGLSIDTSNVRLVLEEGRWVARVLVPHLPQKFPYDARWLGHPPVRADVLVATALFRDLLLGLVPPPAWFPTGWWWEEMPVLPSLFSPREMASNKASLRAAAAALAAVPAAVREIFAGLSDHALLAPDVATLAERLCAITRDRAGWLPRVAALPRMTVIARFPHDWDRLIVLGESELAVSRDERFVRPPLAMAYHQRAVVTWQTRGPAAAAADLDRAIALDPWARPLVTRALLHEALGDLRGAAADYDAAVTASPDAPDPYPDGLTTPEADVARALYSRGVFRNAQGDLSDARADLRAARRRVPFGHGDLTGRIDRALALVKRQIRVANIDGASARAIDGELEGMLARVRGHDVDVTAALGLVLDALEAGLFSRPAGAEATPELSRRMDLLGSVLAALERLPIRFGESVAGPSRWGWSVLAVAIDDAEKQGELWRDVWSLLPDARTDLLDWREVLAWVADTPDCVGRSDEFRDLCRRRGDALARLGRSLTDVAREISAHDGLAKGLAIDLGIEEEDTLASI